MEKEEFYRKYEEYYGGDINEIPYLLEGKDIWLYDLYLSVLKHGGYSCVSRNAKWLKIGKEFGLINKEKNIRLIEIKNIKEYYLNYLREFERIHDNLKKGKVLTKKYRCRIGINNVDVKNKKKSVTNSNGNNVGISSKGSNNKRVVQNNGKGDTNVIIDDNRFIGMNKDSFFVKGSGFRVENRPSIGKKKMNIENGMSNFNYSTNNSHNNNMEINCKTKKEIYHDSYTKERRKSEGKYKKGYRDNIFRNYNNIGGEMNESNNFIDNVNDNNNDIIRRNEIGKIQNNERRGRSSNDTKMRKGKTNSNKKSNNKEIDDQISCSENFVNINNMSCYNYPYNTINNYSNNYSNSYLNNYSNNLNCMNYGDNRYIGDSDYNNNIYSSNYSNTYIFNSPIKNENNMNKCENNNYIGIPYINNNFVDSNCSTLKLLNENNYSEYNGSPITSIGNMTSPASMGYMNYAFINDNSFIEYSKNNNMINNYNNWNGGILNNNGYVDNIVNYMNNENCENNLNGLKNGMNTVYGEGENILNDIRGINNYRYDYENNKDIILSKIENDKCIDIYRLLLGLYKRKENVGDFILCLNIFYSISKMENIISKKQIHIVIWSLLHVLEDILKIFYDGFNSKKRSVYILMNFFKDYLIKNEPIEKRERYIISNMESDSSQYIWGQTLKDNSKMENPKETNIEDNNYESEIYSDYDTEKRNEKESRSNNIQILSNVLFLNNKIEIREMLDLHLSYYEYCVEKKKKIKQMYELGNKYAEEKDEPKKINKKFDEQNEVCSENIRTSADSSASSYYCSSIHSTDIENMNIIRRDKNSGNFNCNYFYKDKKYVENILTKKSSVEFVFIILYILNNMFQISKYNLYFFNMPPNCKDSREKGNENICNTDKSKKTTEDMNMPNDKNEMITMVTTLNEENKNILKKELTNKQIPKNNFYDVSSSDESSSVCSMNRCINNDINLVVSLKVEGNSTVDNSKDILGNKHNSNINEFEKDEDSLYKSSYNKCDGQDSEKLIGSEIKEGNNLNRNFKELSKNERDEYEEVIWKENKTRKSEIKNSEINDGYTEVYEESQLPNLSRDDTENGSKNMSEKCALKNDLTNLNNNIGESIDNSKETKKVNKNKKEVREIYKNLQNEMYKDVEKMFIKKKRKETKHKLIHYFYLSKFLSIFETVFLKNFENIIYHEKVIENVYINMFICIDIINKEMGKNISLKYIFFPSQYLENMNKMKIVAHFSSDNKFYLFSNQENRKNNNPKKYDETDKDENFRKDNQNEKINIEPVSKSINEGENEEDRKNQNDLDSNKKDEIKGGNEKNKKWSCEIRYVKNGESVEKDKVKINGNENKEMDGHKYKKKMKKLFLKIFRKNNRKYNIYKKIDDKYLKEHYNYFESFCCKEKEKMEKDILLNLHGITKNILLKIYKRVNKYLNIAILSLNILAHILYLIPKKLLYMSIIPWILNNTINVKCCYTYVNIPLCILNYNGFIFLETLMKLIIQMIRNNILSIKSYIFSFLRLCSFPLYIYIHFDIPLSHNLIVTSLCLIYNLITYDPDYLATGLIIEKEFQNEGSSVFFTKDIEVGCNNEADNSDIKNGAKKRINFQTEHFSNNMVSSFGNMMNGLFKSMSGSSRNCESTNNEGSVKCGFNTNKSSEKERKNEKMEGKESYDYVSGKRNELLEKTFLKTLFLFLKKFIYFKSILNCANINDVEEMVIDSKRVQDILNNWNLNNKDVKIMSNENNASNIEKKILYLHDNLIIYAKESKTNSDTVKDIKTCYNIRKRYKNQNNTTSNYSYEYMTSNNQEAQKLSIYAHSIISILLFLSSHHNLWESLSPHIPLLVHMALIRTDISSSLWVILKEYYFRNFMRQKRSPKKCKKYYNSKVVRIEKVK
ncbi:conserved Plasmodium protein, unknown function [Plasmodium vinckei vinckei]|uniref:ARID domain-containing protein n=1 Tax=Plasmodium vinckei vinckei TaxID=54757 RepID=A0A081I9B6_PLAVN|nr:conserved Plasmodium protein, unknown function [Plasmodium vinckei vinckei]KEG00274.1 hypothetical protein YYE_04785 [Plasmodium vinckei vinckei]VEV54427.1 conserved Plasmodium protein, unknown function [Plasmodium vinckei vinckei]